MIKVAEIERIRWRHFREGVSVRALAAEFGRSRRTIRKALADPGPWEYRRQRRRPCPVLDPVAKVIAVWLEQDQLAPRKQRHTAHRIYERLVAEYGFRGGESSVRRWVREQRPKARGTLTLALAHDPGVDGQFDFGEAQVRLGGELVTLQLFCARLAHSARDVVRAYRRQTRAAWLDGHVHAFASWGGVPERGWYDNPSQLGRLREGTFEPCEEFLGLQSAYGFRAHHCNPRAGWEKGLVEGLVGYMRRNYLTPVPAFANLEELNRHLEQRTALEEGRRRQGQDTTVGERLAEERGLLGPLPEREYLACTRHPVVASRSQALIHFERRGYSVPARNAGQRLWVRAYAEQLEVWDARGCVARHVRTPGVGEPVVDFWHYLPVLERKPGAFDQALAVRQARFPKEAEELLLALEERWGEDRRRAHKEFLSVCTLHQQVDQVRWRAACATALVRGEVSAAGVRAALEGRAAASATVAALPLVWSRVEVPAGDPSQYQRLLGARG